MRKERGFTLIELLIVLAILAILIGIVALSVGNLRTTATKRGMQSERETVETAINAYVTLQDPSSVNDQATPVKIVPGTTSYGWEDYLKKSTKYYYTWSDVGTADQSVVVWSGSVMTASGVISCTVNGCTGD